VDSFRPGTWTFTARDTTPHSTAKLSFSVEFSTDGGKSSIGKFSNSNGNSQLQVYFDYDVKRSKKILKADVELHELMDRLKKAPAPKKGKAPSLTPIYGYTFCKSDHIRDIEPSCYNSGSVSPQFDATVEEFKKIIPITDTTSSADFRELKGTKFGYREMRNYCHNLTLLEEHLKTIVATGMADNVLTVSVGDEIQLPSLSGDYAQTLFHQFCSEQHADCGSGKFNTTDTRDPKAFFWSNKFIYDFGAQYWKQRTQLIRKYLPKARVGANFSPLAYQKLLPIMLTVQLL